VDNNGASSSHPKGIAFIAYGVIFLGSGLGAALWAALWVYYLLGEESRIHQETQEASYTCRFFGLEW